jgi:hypothetical protein
MLAVVGPLQIVGGFDRPIEVAAQPDDQHHRSDGKDHEGEDDDDRLHPATVHPGPQAVKGEHRKFTCCSDE